MRIHLLPIFTATCILLVPGAIPLMETARAQGQAEAEGPRNALVNGSFESVSPQQNLWYGTDNAGFLRVDGGALPVLLQQGGIGNSAMPVSVATADLNGNGLTDIMVSSVMGYYWVYFNQGTREEPKFQQGELLPLYLSRVRGDDHDNRRFPFRYRGPRVHLADMTGSGLYSLWVGNYAGEIMWIPNTGNNRSPDFRQPRNITDPIIATSPVADRRWGNVFAPALFDFNRNGQMDLLIGEGSYSANNIHYISNSGNNQRPAFDSEDARKAIAFGMGREQLTPAVVDFNGNGEPDLLVADRSGRIGLYSSSITPPDDSREENLLAGGRRPPSGRWQPGDTLDFISYLNIGEGEGRPMNFGGIATVATGDMTGNGLFDLIVGKANGRIALVRNTGTSTEPKFETPEEIRGEPTPLAMGPTRWEVWTGQNKGNFLAIAEVVDSEKEPDLRPPDGNRALKVHYLPSINEVIRTPFQWPRDIRGQATITDPESPASISNVFRLRQDNLRLENGQNYILTFRVRGRGVSEANGNVRTHVERRIREDEIIRGTRGAAQVVRGVVRGNRDHSFNFNTGQNWTEVRYEFRVTWEEEPLNDTAAVRQVHARLDIDFTLNPGQGNGAIYFDDFRLVRR